MGVSKETISKLLIENRFHVKLRILSPEICKQSLRVKRRKAKVAAEKAHRLKTKMNKSKHKLRNHSNVTKLVNLFILVLSLLFTLLLLQPFNVSSVSFACKF